MQVFQEIGPEELIGMEAKLHRAQNRVLGTLLSAPNMTSQDAYNILRKYHTNPNMDVDYNLLLQTLNRAGTNVEAVERGILAHALEKHTIRKTNYPGSPFVIDLNSLVEDLDGFQNLSKSPEVENMLNLIRGFGKIYQNNSGLMKQHHRSLNVDPKTGVYLATTLEGRADMYITNLLTRGIAGFIPMTDAHRTYQLQRAVLTFLDSGGVDARSSNEIIELMRQGDLK